MRSPTACMSTPLAQAAKTRPAVPTASHSSGVHQRMAPATERFGYLMTDLPEAAGWERRARSFTLPPAGAGRAWRLDVARPLQRGTKPYTPRLGDGPPVPALAPCGVRHARQPDCLRHAGSRAAPRVRIRLGPPV